jgi:hypothetical protein
MSGKRASDPTGTLIQFVAILLLAAIWAMILHKGYGDISIIADRYSGADFWRELARYFIGNLAGGGTKPAAVKP